jgi:hypothetical protein
MKIAAASLAFHLLCSNADAFSVGSTRFAKTPTKLRMSEEDDAIPKRPAAVRPVAINFPNPSASAAEDNKEETVIPEAISPPSEPEIEMKVEVEIVKDNVEEEAPAPTMETEVEEQIVIQEITIPAVISPASESDIEKKEEVEEVEIVEDNVGDEAPAPTMEPEVKEEIAIPAAISPPSEPEFELKEEVEIVEDKAPVVAPVAEEPKEVEPVFEEPTTSTKSEESEPALVKLTALQRLSGIKVSSVKGNGEIELTSFLKSGGDKAMLVFGTYAADFNAIEYVQRLRYYLPQLKERGITKIGLVLNCEADAAKTLVNMLDLETDATSDDTTVELLVDPKGEAGRAFGVGTGWRPDDEEMSPYLKLFGMLFGLGAWATLPAVIGGYIGNPFFGQPWIEDAIAVGQIKGRWPNTALELDTSGEIKVNKFKELPYVGGWERRPLELATLRLQNMVDISIKNWKELAPTEDALKAGVLTQLGGLLVVDSNTEKELFRWRDPGICAVTNFEDVLKKIDFIENSK